MSSHQIHRLIDVDGRQIKSIEVITDRLGMTVPPVDVPGEAVDLPIAIPSVDGASIASFYIGAKWEARGEHELSVRCPSDPGSPIILKDGVPYIWTRNSRGPFPMAELGDLFVSNHSPQPCVISIEILIESPAIQRKEVDSDGSL